MSDDLNLVYRDIGSVFGGCEPVDLLRMMRGGYPEKCDFCGQSYEDGRYPVPEEAGAWACSECAARWERQERHDPA